MGVYGKPKTAQPPILDRFLRWYYWRNVCGNQSYITRRLIKWYHKRSDGYIRNTRVYYKYIPKLWKYITIMGR